jgi:hypothetical protein
MRSLRERKRDGSDQIRAARELRWRLKLILKKESASRTNSELELLREWPTIVQDIQHGMELFQRAKQRKLEVSCARLSHVGTAGLPFPSTQVLDEPEVIDRKSRELAEALRQSKSVAVYTGAGISTVSVVKVVTRFVEVT